MSRPRSVASVRLLGDPGVTGADGVFRALERRAAGLLALVALEPGVTRARAAALLWPESDNARQALRQQIARFRKLHGVTLVEGEDALVLADAVEVDALHDPAGALLGNLDFGDCEDFGLWLTRTRGRRREGVVADLTARIAAAQADGELEVAVRLAEQLSRVDEDSEAHHRTLMRLHYLRGDVTQAQAVFEALSRQLKLRFGAQPSTETQSLARALLEAQVPAGAPPGAVRAVPVTVLRPPRMIGRQRELTALRAARAAQRVALVLGEPGLGKSRLLAELTQGWTRYARGVGRPGDAGVPYATLVRLLRAVLAGSTPAGRPDPPPRAALALLLPELAPTVALPAAGQRVMLQAAVESVLAAAELDAIVVDDLHFADEASCEMLLALMDADALAAVRWTLAQRPGEGGMAAARLRDTLEETGRLDLIRLAPLEEQEMAELIESLGLPELDAPSLAPVLVRHTGGNPLYALATLGQGLSRDGRLDARRLPSPGTVGVLLERRLRQLSERAIGLARVAAIAGVDFGIALAEEVTGVRAVELAGAWNELEAAQVLRGNAFAHDLVHEAVLCSIPSPIARHLYGAVARWLAGHGGEAGRIARHFVLAGQPQLAAPHLWEAARLARAALRNAEAAAMLEELADLQHEAGDTAAELVALEELRLALSYVDDAPRKKGVLLRIRGLADTDARRAAAELALARHHFEDRELQQAFEDATAALQSALGAADADLIGRSRLELALVLSEMTRPSEAHAQLDLARDWALASADAEYRVGYHHTRAWAAMAQDDFPRSITAFEACLAITELRDDRAQFASVLGNLAVVLARQGAMSRALHYDEQRRTLLEPEEVGGSTQNYLELNAAVLLGFAGRHAAALAYLERAEQRGLPDQRMLHTRWAQFWANLGQHARALHSADRALAEPSGHPLVRVCALVTKLQVQRAVAAATADAAAALAEIDAIATAEGSRAGAVRRLLARAEFGAPAEAAAHCDHAWELASRSGLQGLALAALTLKCEVALAAGDAAAAAVAADRADALRGEFASDVTTRSRVTLAVARALAHTRPGRAADIVRAEAGWLLERAGRDVPEPFRESFLGRHPHQRAVLEWASRAVLAGAASEVPDRRASS